MNFLRKKLSILLISSLATLLFGFSPVLAEDFTSTNFQIKNPVIESLGGKATSTNFQLQGSIPYIAPTRGTSTNFISTPGFLSTIGSITLPTLDVTAGVASAILTWNNAEGVSSPTYQIGIANGSGGPYTFDSAISATTTTKTSLSFATTYFFVVKTLDSGGGDKGNSNEVSVVPLASGGISGGGGGGGGAGVSAITSPLPTPTSPPLASVIETVLDTLLPGIFIPEPGPVAIQTPLELLVPKIAPAPLASRWNLIPESPIEEFVFRPLPQELRNLAGELPQLGTLFSEVGINRFNDLDQLTNISLSIPGLTDALILPNIGLAPEGLAVGRDIRLDELTPELKARFPTEVLFTKLARGAIDVKPTLRITNEGNSEQLIQVLTGNTLNLSIKPKFATRAVTGFVIFKARQTGEVSKRSLISQVIAPIAHAQQKVVETALILEEFPFYDSDRDGIYTANIEAPAVPGSYEILTLIEYQEEGRGNKAVRLVTVVDPEGYIYEKSGNKEIRIPGSIVSIDWLNPETDQYELWPANEFQQENPQVTDVTGQYSFLVPEGWYQIRVHAPGYIAFDGKPFVVKAGVGVHQNIELRTRGSFLREFDARTVILIFVILMLLYNFYRDKIRERHKI